MGEREGGGKGAQRGRQQGAQMVKRSELKELGPRGGKGG